MKFRLLREEAAKVWENCPELTPLWDEGEAALRSRDPHPRRATVGCALTLDPGRTETPAPWRRWRLVSSIRYQRPRAHLGGPGGERERVREALVSLGLNGKAAIQSIPVLAKVCSASLPFS